MSSTHPTLLEQANVIVRFFLAHGRVELARQALEMLPRELASIREPEERVTEYVQYRVWARCWLGLEKIEEAEKAGASGMARESLSEWLKEYKVCSYTSFSWPICHSNQAQCVDCARSVKGADYQIADYGVASVGQYPGGWCVANLEPDTLTCCDSFFPAGERRQRDLVRIRQIFIPEFLLRLHGALYRSRQHLPQWVPSFSPEIRTMVLTASMIEI